MNWDLIKVFADWLTYGVFGLEEGTHAGDALDFFIYDVIKIFLLLAVMIFLVSYIRTYITPEKARKFLGDKTGIQYNFLAALVGVVTPFCSCSSVPIFIGFVGAGVPLGVTFSFLITSPMVNEAAVAVLGGVIGWTATLVYVISGVLIGTFGGYFIGKMNLEHLVEEFVFKTFVGEGMDPETMAWQERRDWAWGETMDIVKRVWPYIIIGVGVGALFHGYAPEGIMAEYAGKENLFAVPVAVGLGVPLYSNVMGLIPIAESLIGKGLPVGTALAFLMSVTALSLPELIILKKVLKTKLIMIFVAIVATGIVITGYMFNWIL
ncbi:MAG: permease [Thermoplasmata archaeon]|nr:permease [Thermoplasmata archaeon]